VQRGPILYADGSRTGRTTEITVEHGDPFLIRPIPEYLRVYAVDDVRFLPAMFEHFVEHRLWNDEWRIACGGNRAGGWARGMSGGKSTTRRLVGIRSSRLIGRRWYGEGPERARERQVNGT
jgi:hypothetical protein